MSFEDVMKTVMQWQVAAEALAALGAELSLQQSATAAPGEIVDALRGVSVAAGVDVDDLNPQQRATVIALIHTLYHQGAELLEQPAREAGWKFVDPFILDGWGRGSAMVPMMLAGVPELKNPTSFLDIGTGVGLLAISAANVWPDAHIVGIDIWEPSLERARANVKNTNLEDRIRLRLENLVDLTDVDAYDVIWLPSFFMTEEVLVKGLPALHRALQPGGHIAFALMEGPPTPLASAVATLRTIRSGGAQLDAKHATELLENAGFINVHEAPKQGPAPIGLVIGVK
jgi:predicted O-methyltransferase YrrM